MWCHLLMLILHTGRRPLVSPISLSLSWSWWLLLLLLLLLAMARVVLLVWPGPGHGEDWCHATPQLTGTTESSTGGYCTVHTVLR